MLSDNSKENDDILVKTYCLCTLKCVNSWNTYQLVMTNQIFYPHISSNDMKRWNFWKPT